MSAADAAATIGEGVVSARAAEWIETLEGEFVRSAHTCNMNPVDAAAAVASGHVSQRTAEFLRGGREPEREPGGEGPAEDDV